MTMRRATGTKRPHIVCKNCAHIKAWHRNEGPCRDPLGVENAGVDCDCEAWDYGTNVSIGDTNK